MEAKEIDELRAAESAAVFFSNFKIIRPLSDRTYVINSRMQLSRRYAFVRVFHDSFMKTYNKHTILLILAHCNDLKYHNNLLK